MQSDRSASPPIPGFEFLKTLAGQGAQGLNPLQQLRHLGPLGHLSGLSGLQQWVAPTLDPEELEKRIEELRTVQFWLEQNARTLGATIQALEVQKMTLSTLRSMNVKMADLQQVLGAMVPQGGAGPTTPQLADPLKWWGALTEQFQSLAAQALATAPGTPAGAPAPAPAGSPVSVPGRANRKVAAAPRADSSTPAAGKSRGKPRTGTPG